MTNVEKLVEKWEESLSPGRGECAAELRGAIAADREGRQEPLRDLLNNYSCSCHRTMDPCPRCRLAIQEAQAALTAQPIPETEGVREYFDAEKVLDILDELTPEQPEKP